MPGDDPPHNEPWPLPEASRRFLETFREQVRRAGLPGSPELIEKIERALAGKADDESKPPGGGVASTM